MAALAWISNYSPGPRPSGILGEMGATTQDDVGICLSGGGIRSAAFNLGTLQILQEKGFLEKAKWLAAVSGGAYIAGAFTMVTKSIQDRIDGLKKELATSQDAEQRQTLQDKIDKWDVAPAAFSPGTDEVRLLRNNSRYIAPSFRYEVEIVVRLLLGLLVNVIAIGTVLGSVGMSLGLLYGWLSRGLVEKQSVASHELTHKLAFIALLLMAAGLLFALTTVAFRLRDQRRRLLIVAGSVLFISGALFGLVTVVLPWLDLVLRQGISILGGTLKPGSLAGATGIAGGSVALGVGLQVRELLAAAQEAAADTTKVTTSLQKLSRSLRRLLIHLVSMLIVPLAAAAAFIVFVNLGVSHVHWPPAAASVDLVHKNYVKHVTGEGWAILTGMVVAAGLLYGFGDLTNWSMHPYYRRRLSSGYALERTDPNRARQRPYKDAIPLSTIQPTRDFPALLVCAAANVTDQDVTPPGLNAVSFIFSSKELGYRALPDESAMVDTRGYEGWTDEGLGTSCVNITLPAAIAMSGAAISPSMGHMTRPWLRALMALGNIRLGVWVPNPKRFQSWQANNQRVRDRPGRPRAHHLLFELLGLNSIKRRYLYVTDGGHWENLGLVELLRRNCKVIWCFDAAGDAPGKYHTLGEALALASAEANIDVDIDPNELRKADSKLAANQLDRVCMLGTIHYPDKVPGLLIYVRAAVSPADRWSTLSYADANPTFPGDPTMDQLYNYARFDAYHALGRSAAAQAVEVVKAFQQLFPNPPPTAPGSTLDLRGVASSSPTT